MNYEKNDKKKLVRKEPSYLHPIQDSKRVVRGIKAN